METTSGFTGTGYDQNTRLLNQAINRLRECGAEALLQEMPKIAVIGNQSAGKSSLIEAMSGIRVPRKVGTCTRCPMEVVLSQSQSETDPWTCAISLRIMYDSQGSLFTTPQTIPFGDELFNPQHVEIALRRAQDAILSLCDDWEPADIALFVDQTHASVRGRQRSFSRNVVRLEVSAPELVDVTFIDLPGIISNAKEELMNTVNSLIIDHIKQPDCLILVAINMIDDIQNQGAATLARRFDAAGRRTIGVFTKADTVTDLERFQEWRTIISGEDHEHRLSHGYFVTSMSHSSPMATWQEKVAAENDFFQTTNYWSTLAEPLKLRLGSLQLRKKLSVELSRLIQQRVKPLLVEIARHRKITEEQLKLLPTIDEDPHLHLLNKCRLLGKDVEVCIAGNDEKDLTLEISKADQQFLQGIKGAVAQFGLASYAERERGIVQQPANDFLFRVKEASKQSIEPAARLATEPSTPHPREESDDDVVEIVTPSPKTSRRDGNKFYEYVQSQTKKRKRDEPPNVTALASSPDTQMEEADAAMTYTGLPSFILADLGDLIELEEVRARMRRERARRLPGAASTLLQEALIVQAIAPWQTWAMRYLKDVRRSVDMALHKLCNDIFGRYKSTGLFDAVWNIVISVSHNLGEAASKSILEQCRMEHRPFTLDEEKLAITHSTLLKEMLNYRRKELRISANQGPDEFQMELELIAHVLAYISVAYKRFGDMVPMRVEQNFQQCLGEAIQKDLLNKLGVTGDGCKEKCRAYLEDAPENVAKRKELMRRMRILSLANEELSKFRAG